MDRGPVMDMPLGLAGRERELERLLEAWRSCRLGETRGLAIRGERGSGKTSLLGELRRRLQGESRFVAVRCVARETPYGPLLRALRPLLQQLLMAKEQSLRGHRRKLRRALGSGERQLAGLLPELAVLLGEARSDSRQYLPAGASARSQLEAQLLRLLRALSDSPIPLTLGFDDLHLADPILLRWLALLLRSPRPPGLLLIVTRTESLQAGAPVPKAVESAWEEMSGQLETLRLGPLSKEAMRRQLAVADWLLRTSPERPVGERLRALIRHLHACMGDEGLPDAGQLAAWNRQAGDEAVGRCDYGAALGYLRFAEQLLHASGSHAECYEAALARLAMEHIAGSPGEAARLAEQLRREARNAGERARLFVVEMRQHAYAGRRAAAIDRGLELLAELGVSVEEARTADSPGDDTDIAELVVAVEESKRAERTATGVGMEGPDEETWIIEVLMATAAAASFTDQRLLAWLLAHAVRLSARSGRTGGAAIEAYAGYAGLLLWTAGDTGLAATLAARAVELAAREDDMQVKANVYGAVYPLYARLMSPRERHRFLRQAARSASATGVSRTVCCGWQSGRANQSGPSAGYYAADRFRIETSVDTVSVSPTAGLAFGDTPLPTTLALSAGSTKLTPGGRTELLLRALDASGALMPGAQIEWSASGGELRPRMGSTDRQGR
ncbi:putative helix-turn-helix transcriptional regulator, partial [Paenibacillus sp. 598K]|uniref:AAA family ATPase n=1 Tax=Paenibacillus sp. 598K TaxID=1117987 RepID=UPI000FFA8A52